MKNGCSQDGKRDKEVKCEETSESGVVYSEAPSKSFYES